MNSKGTIIIRRGADGWMADYSQTRRADYLIEVMGTVIVPTAYTLAMPGQRVCEKIAELNPGYSITTEGGKE